MDELSEAGSWPEDSSHENGNYMCGCCLCGHVFIGHKRRVVCKLCSTWDNAEPTPREDFQRTKAAIEAAEPKRPPALSPDERERRKGLGIDSLLGED